MTDIVERLREKRGVLDNRWPGPSNMDLEAAAEIERLRSALEFYADRVNYRSNWIFAENVLADRGSIARKALVSCTCGGDLNQPASHHDISCPSTLAPSTRHPDCPCGKGKCIHPECTCALPPSERNAAENTGGGQ